ncbi:TetR/AcrR family transcriptional regulator [Prauserella flavalba]|uniref:TetR/AcrR family transcriptional regulator n=1 Tax=Prauserella flavalba TaxID=1477506 RepID=UPI0036EA64F7
MTWIESAERGRIIEAASHCLATGEARGVSVTDILATSGLSTRAFYRHFRSKDSLLLAMFRREYEGVLAELRDAVATPCPRQALAAWIEGMLRVAAQARSGRRVMLLGSPDLAGAKGFTAEAARAAAAHQEAIAQILRRGRDDGSFPLTDPGPDAKAIRAALHETFTELLSGASTMSTDDAAAEVTRFALRALGAVPQPAS